MEPGQDSEASERKVAFLAFFFFPPSDGTLNPCYAVLHGTLRCAFIHREEGRQGSSGPTTHCACPLALAWSGLCSLQSAQIQGLVEDQSKRSSCSKL